MKFLQLLLLLGVSLLFAIGFASCHSTHKSEPHEHKHDASEHGEEIHLTPAQEKSAKIQTERVEPRDFQHAIRVGGSILPTQGGEQTVVATVDGIVTWVAQSITEGAAIQSGTTMATISAQHLGEGDPRQKTKLDYETALKEYERAQTLVQEQVISTKDFEQVALRYRTAELAYRAQAARMTQQGVKLQANMGGFIKQLLVKNGDYVTVGSPIAVITQNQRLQLRAEVPQAHHRSLREVVSARFIPAYDDKIYELRELNGRLLSFAKSASEKGCYLPITFEFDNIGDFVSGSYAEVFLLTGTRKDVISVPIEALTEQQGTIYVFVSDSDEKGAYLKREVHIGDNNGKRVEIRQGLQPGEHVVVRGAYQVRLAATASIIPEGHRH